MSEKNIETRLLHILEILEASQVGLNDADQSGGLKMTVESCREFVENNESHLAFETLVSNLDELETPISLDLYRQIDEAGRTWSAGDEGWSFLKAYVN